MEMTVHKIPEIVAENLKSGASFVLATIVEGAEKTPGRSGFKLIYYPDGTSSGTVGGGALERAVLEKCADVVKSGENAYLEYELTEDKELKMVCGGAVKVFLEYYAPSRNVYIFGAGHLCRSIVPILDSLNFKCVVIDNRREFADPKLIPRAEKVVFADYLKYIEELAPSSSDSILIFTHGHIYDYELLDVICRRDLGAKYVGMIGSAVKVAKALEDIRQRSYNNDRVSSIYTPVGLNIGTTTTQEIAVAIAAEMLAVYNGVTEIRSMRSSLKRNEQEPE